MALNTMFVKDLGTVCFHIFWFIKELYTNSCIIIWEVVCLQEKYK